MPPWRLLLHGSASPARNMAIDEALLREVSEPVLRLYEWSIPAVSLGYFQPAALAPAGRPFIRRYTCLLYTSQFDAVANFINMPESLRERTKLPKRLVTVALPVRLDSGEVKVFEGHRVQHHLTLGPTKGGLRYHPGVELGEVAALAMWMSWKLSLIHI